ncbi:hypothetical protein [Halomarina rubra]|uniref:Uncharacterized protein n=1 Tax=Halomarina rubra TaxID=2071873 RepID=A0ABD6B1L8_9EURY|nr:hypothetical protein [Halomarina rubra]
MIRAMVVMVVVLVTLAAFFAGVAPVLEEIGDVASNDPTVQSDDTPVNPGIVDRTMSIALVWGPLGFGFAGILFVFVYAIKFERFISGAR